MSDPARSEEESIRAELAAAESDVGRLLDVLKRLVELRRKGTLLLDVERKLAKRLLSIGEPLPARDAVTGALRHQRRKPGDTELRQLRALAHARLGETRRACRELEALAREPTDDPHLIEETFSLLARTYKDQGFQYHATDPTRARKCWMRSFRHYKNAYSKTGRYYSGINSATLALLLGSPRKARELAAPVYDDCRARWDLIESGGESAGDDRYWLAATMGEAALILGGFDDALRRYQKANEIGRHARRFADMGSTRHQLATILLPRLRLDVDALDQLFPMPRLAVFTGHMIDRPDRRQPRFPALPAAEEAVKSAIRAKLDEQDVLLGYASAALGSDILFLEAVRERGGETFVVLPYQKDLFCEDSVALLPGSSWVERFNKILASSKVETVSSHRLAFQGVPYEYANRVLHGMALTKAAQLDSSVVHLAVWDERPGDGPGGTAETVERWRSQGHEVTVIDLHEVVSPCLPATAPRRPAAPVPAILQTKGIVRSSDLVAIFFADAKGFSAIAEPYLPGFLEHFLGLVARQIDALPHREQPLKRNTWGDAVYLVLPDVGVAGRLALDIKDRVRETRWTDFDLPAHLTMRVGLHAGPAYRCLDPVTKRDRFLGAHISLAARIEPIVKPGQIFASETFAVLAAEAGITDFHCRYLGRKVLAKKAATIPVYVLERSSTR